MNKRSPDFVLRSLLYKPIVLGIAGLLVLTLPVRLFDGLVPMPIFPLAIIFLGTIYSPNEIPATHSFSIGVLQDLLSGSPVGVWSSIYLAMQYWLLTQRIYFVGREPHVVWFGFGFVALGAGLLYWLEMCLLLHDWISIWPVVLQFSMTVLFFPVLFMGFSRLHRRAVIG